MRLKARLALVGLLAVSGSARATWYNEGVPQGADIIVMDLRWPYWPDNTYFANWNGAILPGGKITYYAGFAAYCKEESDHTPTRDAARQKGYHPEWVWTFWSGDGAAAAPEFVDTCEQMHASNSPGGEGGACSIANRISDAPEVNAWHRMVARVWTDPDDGRGRMARWMCNLRTGKWTCIGIARFSAPAESMKGNRGFIETVRNPPMPRTLERRLGYARDASTRRWTATPTVRPESAAPVALQKYTDEEFEYAAIQYAADPRHLPWGKVTAAYTDGAQTKASSVSVREPDEPPFLGSGVTLRYGVRDNVLRWREDPGAVPVFAITVNGKERHVIASCAREGCLRLSSAPKTVEIEDIFGNRCRADGPKGWKVRSFEGKAADDTTLRPGFDFVSSDGSRGTALALAHLKSYAKAKMLKVSWKSVVDRECVRVITVRVDGGFELHVDGTPVIVRREMHGSTVYSEGVVLKKGVHDFELEMFNDGTLKGDLKEVLVDGAVPEFRTATPVVSRTEKPVQEKTLVDGTVLRRYRDGTDVFEASTKDYSVMVGDGWKYSCLGVDGCKFGLHQRGKSAFSFFGHGAHLVSKRVKGDFTATMHLADGPKSGDPFEYRTWTGLGAFAPTRRRNWHFGPHWYMFHRPWMNEWRTAPDYDDLGGTRMSFAALRPGDWIRIQRNGKVHTAWTSEDGHDWRLGMYQMRNTAEEMDVGLFVYATLGKRTTEQYWCETDGLEVRAGADPLPPVSNVTATAVLRYTGLAVASSDGDRVLLRSPDRGIVLSRDGGRTWRPANGGLTGAANAVRSAVFDPSNPDVIYRADGAGLHKSVDGGANWTKLPLDCDFDAVGPSAICAEVIAIDQKNPNCVLVGGESKGLHLSEDGGRTWREVGELRGKRITCVKNHTFAWRNRAKERWFTVLTCGDEWMPALGRGKPSVRTEPRASRVVHVIDGKAVEANVREDCGYYNCDWTRGIDERKQLVFATTIGFQGNSGGHFSSYPAPHVCDWWSPATAIAAGSVDGDEEKRCGLLECAVLAPSDPAKLIRSFAHGYKWTCVNYREGKGEVPTSPTIAIATRPRQGDVWYHLTADGKLFRAETGDAVLRRF